MRFFSNIFRFLFLLFVSQTISSNQKAKLIIGRVEKIEFPEWEIAMDARVDTGAHTCSLHVINEKLIEKGSDKFLEFDTEDSTGKIYHMRAKIFRMSKVRNTAGETTQRYVIRQKIKLGGITRLVNINLNDRTELKYNFLIGRNFLRGKFLVDVSLSHTQEQQ